MKTVYYSLPLFGHQFMATIDGAGALNRLSAKFQIWCKKTYGISDTESLCLWIAGSEDGDQYGYSESEINYTARSVVHRLPITHAPIDLTNY